MDTFGSVWRRVLLHCPMAPVFLAREWVTTGWRRICSARDWSFLRGEIDLPVLAAVDVTASIVQGATSITVVGGGGATEVGRQLRFLDTGGGGSPIYTLVSYTGNGVYALDRACGLPNQLAAPARIWTGYLSAPAAFRRWITVIDPVHQWLLHTDLTEQELHRIDPARNATGSAGYALVSRTLSSGGLTRYELWPHVTSALTLTGLYYTQPPALDEDTTLPGDFDAAGDILLTFALAEAASWPGLENRKNPYFSLALAQAKQQEFLLALAQLEMRDEERYLTWLDNNPRVRDYPYAPMDARWLQSHEASV